LKLSFRATSVKYQGKEYKKALLLVDDVQKEVEVQVERGFLKKKMGRLVNLGIVTEKVLIAGNTVTVGGVTAVLESQRDADTLAQLLYLPDVAKALAVAKSSAEKFLRARSSALIPLINLKANQRETLLGVFDEAPEDADPVDVLVSNSEKAVEGAVETMRREIEEARDIPPETRNKVYALVYAVGLVQDSYVKRNESSLTDALGLLSLVAPGSYPSPGELEGKSLDEASDLLVTSGFNSLNPKR